MITARILFIAAALLIIGLFVYKTLRSKSQQTPPTTGGVVTPPPSGSNPGLNEKEDEIGDDAGGKKPGGDVGDYPR